MQLVESLIYLTTIRLDLSYVVSFISKFKITLKVEHCTGSKSVLRYTKGTLDFGIPYIRRKEPRLCGNTYSYWAGCVDDGKSTFGYVFKPGIGEVTWTSKKKHEISILLTE
jgi:hypothetical protein